VGQRRHDLQLNWLIVSFRELSSWPTVFPSVHDVEIEDKDVYVTFTLTYPRCPIGPQVSEQMKEFVGELEGVEGVHPKVVFDPAWTPERMSEDAKFALGF
jgi:metal-sulfur cluster biosynthetic enzyme